ncbi:MAG: bifunctional UDP-N-acetylmuramoyl-tripeptide:D-alanyl-D-alanine ligase/alanine racemase [Bacteroidetes bacterium]|nr:bifunctional UDP-N-acetylmuramoyl-tripeptide:D-alanyl-D-alanine ligase/alanine racemase [Bacteroidota bacterium]
MHYSAIQIQEILQSAETLPYPSAVLMHVSFDTRRIHQPATTLFFALSGFVRSGENYISEAYERGVRNFVIPLNYKEKFFADSNYFQVPDVRIAMQQLARFHREQFKGLMVGITGSNGKTIVKEWLYQLLKNDFEIVRSPRSFNSSIGVPVSLMGIEKWHQLALIEAGISGYHEMEILEEMIYPSMGILTHLGSAHDENFSSRRDKAREKLKLFRNCDVIVYPYDTEEVREEIQELKGKNPLLKTYSWGWGEGAGFCIQHTETNGLETTIQFRNRSITHEIVIPFADKAGIENAMTCLCALSALERWDPEHILAFRNLQGLENRLVFTEGKNGNYLVNDSYSNDLDSLEVALDFLLRQQPDKQHMVVLTDLEQSHPDKVKLYEKVAEMLISKNTSKLIAVGPEMELHAAAFQQIPTVFFRNTDTLIKSAILDRTSNMAILLKGARSYKMERVFERMRKQMHKTWLEIDLNALKNNFNYFRNKAGVGKKMMAMVKAFGYGSGSFEAARLLQFAGADYLAVAYTDEGVQLRQNGIRLPIMVMNCGIDDLQALLDYNLEPVVYNKEGLEAFVAQSAEIDIHLEIDTGMHRLGFAPENVNEWLHKLPVHVSVASVFSHLAASEAFEHDAFTQRQMNRFEQVCKRIEEILGYPVIKHISNTGGILRFDNSNFDMVRLGIGLYGIDPSGISNPELETVVSLKSTISQIRKVDSGDSVGYGRRAVEMHERDIAVIPIGYADGIMRLLGNGNGAIWINGKQAFYTGNICMDMAMCDVTGMECKEGDVVEIFGKHIPIEEIASKCSTIPYEILTSISPRVRREFVGEN